MTSRFVLAIPHYAQVWRRSVWTAWYSKHSFPNPWCNTTSVCYSNTAVSSCRAPAERVRATSPPGWPSTWWTAAPAKSQTASWSLSTCTGSHARWHKLMRRMNLCNSILFDVSCCRPLSPFLSLFFFIPPVLSSGSAALSLQLGQSNRSGNQHVRHTAGSYSGWYSRPRFHQRACQRRPHLQISQMVSFVYVAWNHLHKRLWNCSI